MSSARRHARSDRHADVTRVLLAVQLIVTRGVYGLLLVMTRRSIMFRRSLMTGIAVALLAVPFPGHAQQEFPATLTGHAILPAASFLAAPADAPTD